MIETLGKMNECRFSDLMNECKSSDGRSSLTSFHLRALLARRIVKKSNGTDKYQLTKAGIALFKAKGLIFEQIDMVDKTQADE